MSGLTLKLSRPLAVAKRRQVGRLERLVGRQTASWHEPPWYENRSERKPRVAPQFLTARQLRAQQAADGPRENETRNGRCRLPLR